MTNGKLKHTTTRSTAKKAQKGKRTAEPKKPPTKPATQQGG